MTGKFEYVSMALCVIMMQNLRVVCPQILSFLANCFTQTSHNAQIILIINCLTFWQKFMMYNTVVIHENCEHRFLFRKLKTTWFFWSWLIWSFPRLMSGLRVVLINPRLVSSNDAFDECWVGFSLGNHVFGDDNAVPVLHEIQFLRDQLCSNTAQTINYNVLDLNGSIIHV